MSKDSSSFSHDAHHNLPIFNNNGNNNATTRSNRSASMTVARTILRTDYMIMVMEERCTNVVKVQGVKTFI